MLKPCSRSVGDSWWWVSLTMVPAGNKAKRLLLVNHTTKTIHHHRHQERVSVKLKDFKTVDDSSSFHAFLFKPGALALTAVTQILFACQAKESMTHVMSFYPIPNVTQLNKMFLRSKLKIQQLWQKKLVKMSLIFRYQDLLLPLQLPVYKITNRELVGISCQWLPIIYQ